MRKGIREVFLNTCDFKPRPHSREQRFEVSARLRMADCPGVLAEGVPRSGEIRIPAAAARGLGPGKGRQCSNRGPSFWVTSSEWLHLPVPLLPSCVCLA